MASPKSSDARLYYRCAFQRFEEAKILFDRDKTTGAVYLAGYGVECVLKALILMAVTARKRRAIPKLFRGSKAHEFEWLREQYLGNGGARFPREITHHFSLVNEWSTHLRYTPRHVRQGEAATFLTSTEAIMLWAKERF